MAAIALTIGSFSRNAVVSASDLTRIVQAFKATYGEGLTDQEAFERWASGAIQALVDIVLRTEGNAAAETARSGIVSPVIS